MKISETVRQAAIDSGKTQTELAEIAGTSQRAISQFLRGSAIHLDSIDRLAEAMGVTVKRKK